MLSGKQSNTVHSCVCVLCFSPLNWPPSNSYRSLLCWGFADATLKVYMMLEMKKCSNIALTF